MCPFILKRIEELQNKGIEVEVLQYGNLTINKYRKSQRKGLLGILGNCKRLLIYILNVIIGINIDKKLYDRNNVLLPELKEKFGIPYVITCHGYLKNPLNKEIVTDRVKNFTWKNIVDNEIKVYEMIMKQETRNKKLLAKINLCQEVYATFDIRSVA